ncbi:MAG: hypothetical protein A2V90_09840 [Gammaproteobacteria bacterium RBG_16_57_12]|nr:MAG: hypothetical protein A2V90_09840 [Gammaproteobacteria bacterium RBG_16_57_12]
MIDTTFIDDIAKKLSGLVPPGVQELQQDMEKNIRAVLQSAFARLDLVTRDEFDVQTKVLLRTREMLEHLEKQVAALEARVLEQEQE